MIHHVARSFAGAACTALASAALAAPSYLLTPIDPAPGDLGGEANAVSQRGLVAGWSIGAGVEHAFAWSAGRTEALPQLGPGLIGTAYGVNDDDVVVGESAIAGFQTLAALWTEGEGGWAAENLGTLPDHIFSRAYAIDNASALIAGLADSGIITLPVAWESEGGSGWSIKELPLPEGEFNGLALGLNDLEQVVGFSGFGRALIWERRGGAWTVTVLPGLPGPFTDDGANDANNRGQIVGWAAGPEGQVHAALWERGRIVDLGVQRGLPTYANAINEHGQIVGHTSTPGSGGTGALLWDGGNVYDLNDLIPPETGWHLRSARGIDDSGRIVGWAAVAGIKRPFLLTPRNPADLDGDGDVDGLDLALLLGDWGLCSGCILPVEPPITCPADLNDDCQINGLDLAILLAAWT